MRAVLDASVLIAAFLSGRGASRALVYHAQARVFQLVISRELLDEVERNLRRLDVPERVVRDYGNVLRSIGRMVRPATIPRIISAHPPDNAVLACAVAGGADALATLDRKHLLSLQSYRGIPILSPNNFLTKLRSSQ